MNTRIKIIKRSRNAEDENESRVNQVIDFADSPPAETKTRDMVSTVKSWVAELRDRKRIQPHAFAPLPVILIALTIAANPQTTTSRAPDTSQQQKQNTLDATARPQPATQVTIAVGPSIGASKDLFKVGEAILVTITMTNSSTDPQNICLSGNLYQNLPVLTKNGEPVTISKWTSQVRRIAQHDGTCEAINLPEKIVLTPNTQQIIDWFTLVDSTVPTGGDAWYETLQPGKYELSLQRRLNCCDGVIVQSNKTSFTVAP